MDRVYLENEVAAQYFKKFESILGLTSVEAADVLGIHRRTFSDWKRGKYGFPDLAAKLIFDKSSLELPRTAKTVSVYKVKSEAGRKGGIIRNSLYGSPGTSKGRRRGGINSLETHSRLNSGFKLKKPFAEPIQSEDLAELFGILIGDGGMSKYQVKVTLGSASDSKYSVHVRSLMERVLGFRISVKHFHPSTIDIYLSSRSVVEYLARMGIPVGNKVKQSHRIPDWIRGNNDYLLSCLRGFFDTDGCIFLDKHSYKGRKYASLGLALTTYSEKLRMDIRSGLVRLGLPSTLSTNNNVMIRRTDKVKLFFEIIKPVNEKHLKRYRLFMEECRELVTGRSRKALS